MPATGLRSIDLAELDRTHRCVPQFAICGFGLGGVVIPLAGLPYFTTRGEAEAYVKTRGITRPTVIREALVFVRQVDG